MMKRIVISFALLFSCLLLQAQGGRMDAEKRKEFEAQKVAFFTQEMQLTPEEAGVFWPLYNEMRRKMGEARESMRPDAKIHPPALTEKQAEELIRNHLATEEKEAAIKKEYYHRIAKATSYKKLLLMQGAERNFHYQLWKKLGKEGPPK